MQQNEYSIEIGAECATVRRRGTTATRVGVILGQEIGDGVELIYLDRLVLPPGDIQIDDNWSARGCISTILVFNKPPVSR